MAKQKKKRNKVYSGQDAKTVRPSVTRVSAVHRNPIHQWWIDNKRVAKPILIGVAVVIVVVWLIIELIRITSGGLT